jgi:hypothetical protein
MKLYDEVALKDKKLALKEFQRNKDIIAIPYNPDATQFVLANGVIITFKDVNSTFKKLIFKCLNFVHYKIYHTDEMFISSSKMFNEKIPMFIPYLNNISIDKGDDLKILKIYETYRVDLGIKSQSTGMKEVRSYINKAIESSSFTDALSESEIISLQIIGKTRTAPSHESEALTMTVWFSWHTWLRREDIGIGAELYARLASPKALVKSFNITIKVGLLQIQNSKYALIEFFKGFDNSFNIFPEIKTKEEYGENKHLDQVTYSYKYYLSSQSNIILNNLRELYHSTPYKSADLKKAMVIVVYSLTKLRNHKDVIDQFFKNEVICNQVHLVGMTCSSSSSPIFSPQVLLSLYKYSKNNINTLCPITPCEELFFSWIMGSLRVQPNDIQKLRLFDFQFTRKVDGTIINFECIYFKGRAKDYHVTEIISGRSIQGKALINFFNDRTLQMQRRNTPLVNKAPTLKIGKRSLLAKYMNILNAQSFNEIAISEHNKQGVAYLFLPALLKVIKNGFSFEQYKRQHKIKLKGKSDSVIDGHKSKWKKFNESFCKGDIFGLACIKNSSVHAKSDKFDPTKLLNLNSHTNETEDRYYRNSANEEWTNNCGRITRAVMQDIQSNLYQLSKTDKQIFISEFINANDSIQTKKSEILSRIKMLTGQEEGQVTNEFGFGKRKNVMEGDLPDAIYLLDSPETVMKLKHYLWQAELHHQAILKQSPDFLFNTLLPTVEWIEDIFIKSRFSKASISKGEKIFEQFKGALPPIFRAYQGH